MPDGTAWLQVGLVVGAIPSFLLGLYQRAEMPIYFGALV